MNTEKMNRIDVLAGAIELVHQEMHPLEVRLRELQLERNTLVQEVENEILAAHQEVVDRFNEEGAEYIFVDIENADDLIEVCEDDGTLHISFGKIRGCFICNQDISRSVWNKEANSIMKTFSIPKDLQSKGRQ